MCEVPHDCDRFSKVGWEGESFRRLFAAHKSESGPPLPRPSLALARQRSEALRTNTVFNVHVCPGCRYPYPDNALRPWRIAPASGEQGGWSRTRAETFRSSPVGSTPTRQRPRRPAGSAPCAWAATRNAKPTQHIRLIPTFITRNLSFRGALLREPGTHNHRPLRITQALSLIHI